MPTGYTAAVQDGTITEFRDYALRCARAFGPCVMQRDDDPSDPPKEQGEDSYYQKMVDHQLEEIEALKHFTDKELEFYERNHLGEELKRIEEIIKEKELDKIRYESMLEKVRNYNPPSSEYENYKNFMIEQLESSIKWDCRNDYYSDELVKVKSTLNDIPNGEKIRENRLQLLLKDLEYCRNKLAEEKESVDKANQWIRQLYESLENGR